MIRVREEKFELDILLLGMLYSDADMKTILDLKLHLLSKVNKTRNGCWEWQGATAGPGYGVLHVEGRAVLARRIIYELWRDTSLDNCSLRSTCKNNACVNPEHLILSAIKKGGVQSGSSHEKTKYPWTRWLRKQSCVLQRGKHYGCQPHSIAMQIRAAANRLGIKINVQINDDKITVRRLS